MKVHVCLQIILETLANACATYGRKNLRILYDALSTLAELVGSELAEPSLLRIFMPPLVAKWQSLGDTDRELLPLLECFTGITSAIGEHIACTNNSFISVPCGCSNGAEAAFSHIQNT